MTRHEIEQTQQSILYMCRLTFKTISLVIIVSYAILYIFLTVENAEAATLKSNVVIEDNVIRASDLFTDVPEKKDAILGSAPQPGQSIILGARTLQRIASVYDIDWKSTSSADQILVKSSSQTLTGEEITAGLKEALASRGVDGDFNLTLGNVAPSIILPGNVPATLEITQLSYTPGRDVFNAVVVAPSAANPLKTLSVSGIIEKTTEVPVLKSTLQQGDIIGSSDIEWVKVSARHMVRDTIIDADKLMGKTPVRSVAANTPVRDRDVMLPQLVSRGDEVLIEFTAGPLQLTAKGKAMQNGAEGDTIRVLNLSSNESLRAEITGDKLVKVQ